MITTGTRRRLLQLRYVRAGRNVRELARLHQALRRSRLFDPDLYRLQRRPPLPGRSAAVLDYLLVGSGRGLVGGALLVPPTPRSGQRPGLAGAAEWCRVLRSQGFPDRVAHPAFDSEWYRQEYLPDSDENPLDHYLSRPDRTVRTSPRQSHPTDLVALARDVLNGYPRSVSRNGATERASIRLLLTIPDDAVPAAITALAASTTPLDVVLVPSGEPSPQVRLALAALATLDSFRVVVPEGGEGARTAALAVAAGVTVVSVTCDVEFEPDDLARLAGAAGPGVLAVPVLINPDGTVAAAGLTEDGQARLSGHPWADASRQGTLEVARATNDVVAFDRADALRALQDTSAGAPNERDRDLRTAVVGAVAFRLRSAQPSADHYPAPGYVASGRTRWAIKSPHPSDARGRTWGDYHFAHALARALERAGQEVAVDPLDSWYRASGRLDDVVLVLRGLHRYRPVPGQLNVLWVISHPELVTTDELKEADLAFAASSSWAAEQSEAGVAVEPLLQCTDPEVFAPGRGTPGTGWPVLFVGNTRGTRRPLVEAAARLRPDLAVIGSGWEHRLAPAQLKGRYLANEQLAAAYRSAGVVLNDHWQEMGAAGFLSNRLFDLTAAGARWISDPVPGLTQVFPTGRVATDESELERLLADPAALPAEPELAAAAAATRRDHSFDARAGALVAAVQAARQRMRA